MNPDSPLMSSDELGLRDEDLLAHLDAADALAARAEERTEEDLGQAPDVIEDLMRMIRSLLIEHRQRSSGECGVCTCA
jgi:hypothetical protein